MSNYIFLYKENNTDDKDCVKYLEINKIGTFQCDHYFRGIHLYGACFSSDLEFKQIDFNNITSILTKDEFKQLDEYNKAINELGYEIKINDARYTKGIELYNNIKSILDKLLTKENEELFNKVIEEEKEWLKENYALNDDDIFDIYDVYTLDFKDRDIVHYVYNNIDECSQKEAESLGYANESNSRWFDFELFGSELLEEEHFLELNNGQIVLLNC